MTDRSPQVPTIGRRVYYWPGVNLPSTMMTQLSQALPFDAGVVFVHPEGPRMLVNLLVTDHVGLCMGVTDVPFGAPAVEGGEYADWMPYQKGASHTAAPEATETHGKASEHPFPRFGDRSRSVE